MFWSETEYKQNYYKLINIYRACKRVSTQTFFFVLVQYLRQQGLALLGDPVIQIEVDRHVKRTNSPENL